MNEINPNSIKKINRSTIAFKEVPYKQSCWPTACISNSVYDLIMPDGKHRSVFESLQELGNERSGHFPNARLVRHEGFILSKSANMYDVPSLKIIPGRTDDFCIDLISGHQLYIQSRFVGKNIRFRFQLSFLFGNKIKSLDILGTETWLRRASTWNQDGGRKRSKLFRRNHSERQGTVESAGERHDAGSVAKGNGSVRHAAQDVATCQSTRNTGLTSHLPNEAL